VARCGGVNAADARRVAFNPIDKSETEQKGFQDVPFAPETANHKRPRLRWADFSGGPVDLDRWALWRRTVGKANAPAAKSEGRHL
jgi:hypothetical protein